MLGDKNQAILLGTDYASMEVMGDWLNQGYFRTQTSQENGTSVTKIQYGDAKTMFATIKTQFGGNEATKKTQQTLLKQQYKNFSACSTESLDSIFNRLQKIVSRLAILGVVITQEDLNSKFLRSLPPEWKTHVVVWMNKADTETLSIDDLYNNFKIVEQDVKKSVGASSVSTANFSDNTVYAFMVENPNGSNLLQQDLEQIHEDDLEAMDLMWKLSLLSMGQKGNVEHQGTKRVSSYLKWLTTFGGNLFVLRNDVTKT
ncbi:hypothetical protein Tco_0232485 [Tanacetum coccineum]